MADIHLPPNIENYSKIVSELQNRDRLSGEQKKKLALCKLKIALWSCKTENVSITRYSLAEILGPDTSFVFQHAQTALMEINWDSEEDRAAMRRLAQSYQNRKSPQQSSGESEGGFGTYR